MPNKPGRPPMVTTVLTARSTSTRYPNKVLADVEGKPLLYWIAKKLADVGNVVLAIPEGDDILWEWGKAEGFPTYAGSMNDVTGRIMNAANEFYPNTRYIMRGLGDMPFIVPEFVTRAAMTLHNYDMDAFIWATPPFIYTTYGASDFPRSRRAWEATNANGVRDEREHPDLYYHRHRDRFKIVYHEPPPPLYFRPYRLEVDWDEDLELIRRIAKAFGKLPSTEDAIGYLDKCDDWRVNRLRVERTGLMASYRQSERAMWWKIMVGQPVVRWDDTVVETPKGGVPVFCAAKVCYIGYTVSGKLYRRDAVIEGDTLIKCACGANKHWTSAAK